MRNMLAIRNTIFIALGVLTLAACRPVSLYFVGADGPPEYQLGWEDGCDAGLSAQGSPIYKAMFGFRKRPELNNNELYRAAWNEGFTYCRFSLAREGGDIF